MRKMKATGVEWCPSIPDTWSIGRVKGYFAMSKDLSSVINPTVLKLARSGICVKDITINEGQMAESYENYNKVRPGDLLLNPMDLYSGANCNVAEIEGVISPAYTNLRYTRPLVPKYYDYYFKIQYWTMAMFAHGKGVSYDNRWTINADGIKNYEIPVPSYEEQVKIVNRINADCERVDALITNQQAQIEKLKQYKQSLITEVVTKGLNPNASMKDSGIEWLGLIPEHWSISRARYIGTVQNGISKGGEYFGSGDPFVSYGDVYKNFELPKKVPGKIQSTPEEKQMYSVEYGDIFFTRTSETIEEVGFSSVCNSTIEGATFAGFIIRLRPFIPDDLILTDFAKYYFRSDHLRNYYVKEMNIVTRASLSQGLLKAMSVLVPPKAEQHAIATFLNSKCNQIDALVSNKLRKISEIKNLKKSLIYEYVTGKKEVN